VDAEPRLAASSKAEPGEAADEAQMGPRGRAPQLERVFEPVGC
jgi:hypothetical protein